MKRSFVAVPALLIGIGIGGLLIPQAFAASTPNTTGATVAANTSTASSTDWLNYMNSMMGQYFGSTPQSKSFINEMDSVMTKYFGSSAAKNGDWLNGMNSMMGQYFGSGTSNNGTNAIGSMMGGYWN